MLAFLFLPVICFIFILVLLEISFSLLMSKTSREDYSHFFYVDMLVYVYLVSHFQFNVFPTNDIHVLDCHTTTKDVYLHPQTKDITDSVILRVWLFVMAWIYCPQLLRKTDYGCQLERVLCSGTEGVLTDDCHNDDMTMNYFKASVTKKSRIFTTETDLYTKANKQNNIYLHYITFLYNSFLSNCSVTELHLHVTS